MVNIYEPMPQAINQQLGVKLELTVVQAGEYGQKLATTLAGDGVPRDSWTG